MSGLTKDFTSVTTTEWAIRLTWPSGRVEYRTHCNDHEGTRFPTNRHLMTESEAKSMLGMYQGQYQPVAVSREVIRLEGPWEEA